MEENESDLGGGRVLLAKFIDAATGVDDFLLTGIERVAIRTNLDLQIVADGGAGFERIPAGAGDVDRLIFGMDFGFHGTLVIVCGRINAHPDDAIATPPQELPPEFENSMATTLGPRIICAYAAPNKILCA
jgi:hypothetical protein